MAEKNNGDQSAIELRQIQKILWRHKIFIFGVIAACVFAAGTYSSLATPIFMAKSSVLIEDREYSALGNADFQTGQMRDITRAHRVLALSKPVLQRVAFTVGTSEWPEVQQMERPDELAPLGEKQATVSIESNLLILEVQNASPEKAALLANAWAKEFVKAVADKTKNLQRQKGVTLNTESLDLYEKWLKSSENLQEFMTKNNYNPNEREIHPIRTEYKEKHEKLIQLGESLTRFSAELDAWNKAMSKGDLILLQQQPRARNDQILVEYERALLNQRLKLGETEKHFAAESTELKIEKELYKQLEEKFKMRLTSIGEQIQQDHQIVKQQYDQTKADVKDLEPKYKDWQSKQQEYDKLNKTEEMAKERYKMISDKAQEVDLSKNFNWSTTQEWEIAEVPNEPYKPKWALNLVLGFLAGTLLAAGGVYIFELLDDTVQSPTQLKSELGLNVLGTIPQLPRRLAKKAGYFVAKEFPRSIPVESMRTLRSSLTVSFIRSGKESKGSVFLVTSPLESEGKSFVSNNLSYLFAHSGKRTLLVDADLYKSTLTHSYGLQQNMGVSNVLLGPHSLQQLVSPTQIPNLFLLSTGGVSDSPSKVIESPQFHRLLEEARNQFEVIILDAPPVLAVADASTIAEKCDAVLVVIKSRSTRMVQVERVNEILNNANAKELAYVVNGIHAGDLDAGGYGSGYGYGYGYGYGSYGYGQNQKKVESVGREIPNKVAT